MKYSFYNTKHFSNRKRAPEASSFRQSHRKQSMATEMAKTGDFFFIFFAKKHQRRMKNVHINVRPHILLPKVVSVKNSHFSTENANVVTWSKKGAAVQ